VIKTIRFAKPPYRDSKGRDGFIQTSGVEICEQGACDEDRDDCIMLNPINSRGEVSAACRLSIARAALPAVIAALQEIAGLRSAVVIMGTVGTNLSGTFGQVAASL
jgi:hypothetical protein